MLYGWLSLVQYGVKRFIKRESGFTILEVIVLAIILVGITAGAGYALSGGVRGMTGYQLNVMQCSNPGFAQNNPSLCN